jgi:hypothetical protein
MTSRSTSYDFFGRTVRVESDSAEAVEALDIIYSRQRLQGTPTDGDPDLTVRIRGRRIEVGDRTIRVPDEQRLVHYAHLVLINAAASLVDDALVLHAGAVTSDGLAVLLIGHSGRGKSTLTLELVRRGWGFLSDDFAVLRSDGVVIPFPRRVNVTDKSLALLQLETPTDGIRVAGFGGREKWMIDIDSLFPGKLCAATRLGAIVLLGGASGDQTAIARAWDHTAQGAGAQAVGWRLEFDHLPERLIDRLAAIPGVTAVLPLTASVPPVVELAVDQGVRVVGQLDEISSSEDVAILSARRLEVNSGGMQEPAAGGFEREPILAPVLHEEALVEVLGHALSLSGMRFLSGTSDRMLLESVAILHGALRSSRAPIFRLQPGYLSATATAVQHMFRSLERL